MSLVPLAPLPASLLLSTAVAVAAFCVHFTGIFFAQLLPLPSFRFRFRLIFASHTYTLHLQLHLHTCDIVDDDDVAVVDIVTCVCDVSHRRLKFRALFCAKATGNVCAELF